jgi:hypothetical protein
MTSPLPLIERTPDGDQYMLHGFTPVDVRERLEHLGAHTGSPSSVRCALAKISRCVTSENSKLNPYPTTRSTAKATLSFWVNTVPGTKSASAIAEGLTSAIVARSSKAASRRAVARLYSWTWCLRPPRRKDAPSMKSVLVTIAPAMEPFTSAYSPAPSAAAPITSSVRFPSVALSEVAPVDRTDFPLR